MVDDYDWKYCSGMHVGYTYELHWPHSNMGDCPTAANPWPKWQYQSHFMDGTSQCTARHVLVALHLAISPFRLLTRPPHNASTSTHLHASPIYPQPSTRLRKSTPFSALTRRFARTIQVTIQVLARRRPPSFGYPSRTPPAPHTPAPGMPSAGVLCQANQIFGTTALPDETAAVNAVFSGHTNFTARVVKLGVHAQVVNK